MKVSVVIPAYNAASTLAESLESVIAQTCPDWEAILVDDGSSDATFEIANAFAERDPRIRVVRQRNGGESAARNTGVDHARYDWLLFLDADDWIAPAHLERFTSELAAHPELDAAHCGWVRVALDGTLVSDDYRPPAGDLFPILACRAAFPVHACMVRRSLVIAVGKLDTALQTCPDWDLWQRIARTGARFGALPEVLAYYRMTPNSSSLDARQLFRDGLTVLERGHAPDPRVSAPHPDYANGLIQDMVESQVFYLLSWNAGLLLGAGKDATVLLEAVRNYHYSSLYPAAVAKCLFEAGTLPASQPRDAWETLLPRIAGEIEEFLKALEAQSQTPDLGTAALLELKKLILRRSPVWQSVWAHETALLEETLEQTRAQAHSFERILAQLRRKSWIRLGAKLGALKEADFRSEERPEPKPADQQRPSVPEAFAFQDPVNADCLWQLQVAPGNVAALRLATGNPEAARVDISEAHTGERWHVQLNFGGLKVAPGSRYEFHFRARSDQARTIGVGIAKAHAPWTNLGFYKEEFLTPNWQTFRSEVAVTSGEDNARAHFDLGGRRIGVEVSDVCLSS
jgi:glycosyltransferase involved in cell wall biosynthesis